MNEFYVGYVRQAPRDLSRFIGRAVICAVALAMVVAAVLVFAQQPFAPSRFEFGQTRTFDGQVALIPYPVLLTATDRYLLVAPGKHGATNQLASRVHVVGSLIERPSDHMIEVLSASTDPGQLANSDEVVLGSVSLTGEIVDTKCHFGVMNPGSGKVHRDCAVRCISGGIPPGLMVRDRDGSLRTVLLAASDGRELHREILDYVAEPVHVHGALVRSAGFLILRADPSTITRE
jgi:hypothetical protein